MDALTYSDTRATLKAVMDRVVQQAIATFRNWHDAYWKARSAQFAPRSTDKSKTGW